jgi:hypothetical protein
MVIPAQRCKQASREAIACKAGILETDLSEVKKPGFPGFVVFWISRSEP